MVEVHASTMGTGELQRGAPDSKAASAAFSMTRMSGARYTHARPYSAECGAKGCWRKIQIFKRHA